MEKKTKIISYSVICAMAAVLAATAYYVMPEVYAEATAADVLSVVHTVLKYISVIIGIVLFLSGIMKYVVAKQNDSGPEEHKAAATMAVGIVLIILFTVIIDDTMMTKIAGWIS